MNIRRILNHRAFRAVFLLSAFTFLLPTGAMASQTGGNPVAVINNLQTFMFQVIRAVGMILLGFGVVQIGLSLKSHDPGQRANGFLTLAGGVIIMFAKESASVKR